MQTITHTNKAKNDSDDLIILSCPLTSSQISTIHISLTRLDKLLDKEDDPSWDLVQQIWIKRIQRLVSHAKDDEDILKSLKNLVKRNFMETLTLEKMILKHQSLKDDLYQKWKDILSEGLDEESFSKALSEMFQILTPEQRKYVVHFFGENNTNLRSKNRLEVSNFIKRKETLEKVLFPTC